jgi:hypothetical protein
MVCYLASIDCQCLGDDQQSIGELCDGQLLPAAQSLGKVLEGGAQSRLHSAPTCDIIANP